MSTFDGIVDEFPNIRIDYFKRIDGRTNPLACFLSHVHSDHTRGLKDLRSPFVYCSSATREILLNIERYSQRINFSKGVVETKEKSYRHLQKVLRPIPLGVPTEITLPPQEKIRVTLFDANHCPGSVMFLIEGANGKAILYTGDVRAEKWWIDSLIRHPALIPYTHGHKVINTVYLDTTFATHENIYREFPSKSEGISELLRAVSKYPDDTTFYLQIRTFGYEDVWQALSVALGSKVHVDRYQWGLFAGLCRREAAALGASEGAALCGFNLGNERASGCLSNDESQASRIHSCDPPCPQLSSKKFVILKPIVNRVDNGTELPEVGLGGGQDDIFKTHELELSEDAVFEELKLKCMEAVKNPVTRAEAIATLSDARSNQSKSLILDDYGIKTEGSMDLKFLIRKLVRGLKFSRDGLRHTEFFDMSGDNGRHLSDKIKFPFSRHSSYSELCELIQAFRPRDIIPCTVDKDKWSEQVSMKKLFGHLCSDKRFRHDQFMRDALAIKGSPKEQAENCFGKRPRMDCSPSLEQMTSSPACDESANEDISQEGQQQTYATPEPKRQRITEAHSSFKHSPSQVIDLTTPDTCPLELFRTSQLVEHPPSQLASIAIASAPSTVKAVSHHSVDMTPASPESSSSEESSHSPIEARKRVADEMKKLMDQGQLDFQVVTDSYPGPDTTANEALVLPPPTIQPSQTECDTNILFSQRPLSQTRIPCSISSDTEIRDDGLPNAFDHTISDDDEDEEGSDGIEMMRFPSQMYNASQSQRSVITLSTANFESQSTNTTDSTGGRSSKMARRRRDVEERKKTYRAVRAGTYEGWSKVYHGPYVHEDEI
ncbi:hypothetical protein KEM56_000093 [Ascosphaera pollenicola]|nr:hypothetical protein KEM56_000093 [Ascosphaera pollenicola]